MLREVPSPPGLPAWPSVDALTELLWPRAAFRTHFPPAQAGSSRGSSRASHTSLHSTLMAPVRAQAQATMSTPSANNDALRDITENANDGNIRKASDDDKVRCRQFFAFVPCHPSLIDSPRGQPHNFLRLPRVHRPSASPTSWRTCPSSARSRSSASGSTARTRPPTRLARASRTSSRLWPRC